MPIEVRQTTEFTKWFFALRDERAADRIASRIRRLELDNPGDVKFFDGIGEMRVDYGPGYRVYFVRREKTIIVLLCGGDKRTQARDIRLAKRMAEEI